jgi:hypothetical protein
MRAEDGHRLAGLDQQGLVRFEPFERRQERFEAIPIAGRLAASAIDDQVVRVAGDLRIEVVLQHAIGGFDQPVLAGELRAARGSDNSRHGQVLRWEAERTRSHAILLR